MDQTAAPPSATINYIEISELPSIVIASIVGMRHNLATRSSIRVRRWSDSAKMELVGSVNERNLLSCPKIVCESFIVLAPEGA